MKSFMILGALAALGSALPQEIQWDVVDAAADPPTVVVPIGAEPDIVTYNPVAASSSAAAVIVADPLPQVTSPLDDITIEKRDACSPQPTGAGPVPSPDTASSFLSYEPFAAAASAAPTPSGYLNTFTNLKASNSAYGYMGYTTLDTYSSVACATECDSRVGCSAFNILFERDPSIEPGAACADPPSTTVIKCVFWGGPVSAENANNDGQWRDQFHVVIAGSNGYVSKSIAPQDGYTGPESLGTAAINAPLDCAGGDTFMGSKVFTSGPFDAGLCASACSAQSEFNIAHHPANQKPQTCQFFNTYLLLKNGVSVGQTCAMYSQAWSSDYAKNTGQWRGNDQYTIAYSYTFVNSTDAGKPAIPCPVASATSAIISNTLQPYCSSLLQYTTPVTTVVVTTSTAVPSTTVVETSIPVTTATITITSLVTVTQAAKRDVAQTAAINFDDYVVRRDTTPAALTAFPADVISSACSLQAVPVTSTSSLLTTTTATYTSGAFETTTILAATTATSTVIVVSTTAVAPACAVPTGNLLQNPGFESGNLSPWYEGATDSVNSGSLVTPGSNSASTWALASRLVRVSSSPYSRRFVQQDVTLCAGSNYNVGFDYRFTENGPDCYAYYFITYADGSAAQGAITVRGVNNNWQTTGGSFTATSARATIQIVHLCANYESGRGFFDNVKLTGA